MHDIIRPQYVATKLEMARNGRSIPSSRLLGIKIYIGDVSRTMDVNYDTRIAEIKKAMSLWTQRGLTPLGRVLLVKSSLLSKFAYLF